MKLRPIDSPELIELAAGWLSREDVCRWLDFGDGKQTLSPAWLKILTQRDTHLLRLFTADDGTPAGVVALSEINRHFRTARIWVAVGERSLLMRGYGTQATAAMLAVGFRELGLRSISTWVVDGNPSIKVAERVGFKFIGRQRQCHAIDGRLYDRLWFDILSDEHMEPDGDRHGER